MSMIPIKNRIRDSQTDRFTNTLYFESERKANINQLSGLDEE